VEKSAPAGAKPAFDHQGLPVSNVGGLNQPGTYTFTLRVFDDLHMTTKDVNIVVTGTSGVVETAARGVPQKFALEGIRSNPVSSSILIQYAVPVRERLSRVSIAIFSADGRKVRTLVDAPTAAGYHAIIFNTCSGSPVLGGLYFCHMEAEGYSKTVPVFLIK
jgi:hypothetical protein